MVNHLNNKHILFLSPRFFGYEKRIIESLNDLGAKVTYFDERLSDNFFVKAAVRFGLFFLISPFIYFYYKNILKNINDLDYLFVNTPECLPAWWLSALRRNFPKAKFIMYLWDSVQNKPHCLSILENFDYVYTFDNYDSVKYCFRLKPLFFIENSIPALSDESVDIDIFCACTLRSDRYKFLQEIEQLFSNEKKYIYIYYHNKYIFMFLKFFKIAFCDVDIKKIKFKKLSYIDTQKYYSKSKCVVDVPHPGQNGLTIRTIESIGFSKKLITKNSNVKNYNFYDMNNIYIFEPDNKNAISDFLSTPYNPIDSSVYDSLKLRNWLLSIF